VENGLLDVIGREGVGSIAFSPLEQGVLTDRYLNGFPEDSRAMRDGRYLNQGKISPERLEIARKLNVIAKERDQSLAQMAIAWLLKDPRITSVLIGASSPQQVGALANLHFSDSNLAAIEAILRG
jgi:L-glyceraldehyde 3-phosphate reductase